MSLKLPVYKKFLFFFIFVKEEFFFLCPIFLLLTSMLHTIEYSNFAIFIFTRVGEVSTSMDNSAYIEVATIKELSSKKK